MECHETAIAEVLKTAEDRHAQELKNAYLVTRPKRRMFALHGPEPVILEGIPIYPPEWRRLDLEALWKNHPNYASPCAPVIVLKTFDYCTQKSDNPVVCRVSSGNPESSTFYNSYRINNRVTTTLQHWYKNFIHRSWGRFTTLGYKTCYVPLSNTWVPKVE